VRTGEGRAERFMSEFNDDHSANGTAGEGLPHHHSPSMVPNEKAQEQAREPVDPSEISIPSRAIEPASRAAHSTVLLLALPRPEDATAGPARESTKTRSFSMSPAMSSVIAVLVGAALGSVATAVLLSIGGTPTATPADPMTFTATLERVDRELTNLKASIEGSAKQSNAQVAKITDRLDRADKTQTDTAAKVARTTESLDRIDHRLNGAAEQTGAVPSASLAPGPGRPPGANGAAILDGWVLRDLFNGGALIQSPRNGVLEVIPGDNVPGLGRIDAIRRQDGRWVVVTSRGLIVAR
jgi:hypothetical protein